MSIKQLALTVMICVCGLVAAHVFGGDNGSAKPSIVSAVDPIGQGMAQLNATLNPPLGVNVDVMVDGPTGELHGQLKSTNDHWTVLNTDDKIGVFWIPTPKIAYVRLHTDTEDKK